MQHGIRDSLLASQLSRHLQDKDTRVLIVTRHAPSTGIAHSAGELVIDICAEVRSAGDINRDVRADLGIIVDQIEHMNVEEATHLLSAMRDRYCTRVALHISDDTFADRELLALGFAREERPTDAGRFYSFDPAEFFEGRSWNSPENWAHPENFKRRRW